jgi:hypothetical protein
MQLFDGGHELGVGFDGLFYVQNVSLHHIDGFVDFLQLGAKALHKRVVKRRSYIGFPENCGAVSED